MNRLKRAAYDDAQQLAPDAAVKVGKVGPDDLVNLDLDKKSEALGEALKGVMGQRADTFVDLSAKVRALLDFDNDSPNAYPDYVRAIVDDVLRLDAVELAAS